MKNQTTTKKLIEAEQKSEEFIQQMQKFDDKKLEKHLDLFRQQMETAYKHKNSEALNLLSEYERQLIEARVRKLDNI